MSGPLTYQGLYGGEAPPASDPAATRTMRFVLPRGETPAAPLGLPFVANAILADNPSGWWYYINGRWLPPWTIGAIISVDPPSPQLEILAQTPTGELPEATGADLVLVASEARLDPEPGLYVPSRTFTWAPETTLFAGNALSAASILVGVAGARIAVVSATLVPIGGVGAEIGLRDWCTVDLFEDVGGVVAGAPLGKAAISPGSPMGTLALPPGGAVTGVGFGVMALSRSRPGSGTQYLTLGLAYYLV